jgi:hypothetical protein
VDKTAVDALLEQALESLAREEWIGPDVLVLLLRRYARTGDPALSEAIGVALGRALDDVAGLDSSEIAEWTMVFVEAAALSDDARLREAVVTLTGRARSAWPREDSLNETMREVGACLCTLRLVDQAEVGSAAVDELERVIGVSYRPGAGLHRAEARDADLADFARTAATLLTAYAVTTRLPYAMLADDLMQFAKRRWWDEKNGGYATADGADDRRWFSANAEAARVLWRLGCLHADPAYRAAAVMADGCDHAADARRVKDRLTPLAERHGLDAAVFGLLVSEMDPMGDTR